MLALVPSLILPVWKITLNAPQYPGGLDRTIYAKGAEGRPGRGQLPPMYDLALAGFLELFAELRGLPLARVKALDLSLAEAAGTRLRALSGGILQKAYLGLARAAGPGRVGRGHVPAGPARFPVP